MSERLTIHHQGGDGFVVMSGSGKVSKAVELCRPEGVAIEGTEANLPQELRWYLEEYLDYPYSPNDQRADRVLKALSKWGQACFEALFSGVARDWYTQARQSGLEDLTLNIASDEPSVLGWPWEALCDQSQTLAHLCSIERQLHVPNEPVEPYEALPRDQINILLIIARPLGDKDVGYHAIARAVVELATNSGPDINVDVLRPPTFAQLQSHLRDNRGHYHIVHFDGHGGYGDSTVPRDGRTFEAAQGKLIFETDDNEKDPVSATKLSQLLAEHRIPVMVLNACQSARIDATAETAFASVAASLISAGVRSVLAMGYNLYVSGAQQLLPAFYRELFKSGDTAQATREGRKAMLTTPVRASAAEAIELQDWLVPVLYQQSPLTLERANQSAPRIAAVEEQSEDPLPEEALRIGSYGFIGRERIIQQIERASQPNHPAAGILIRGMAGIGKTTVAAGYLRWLRDTGGLPEYKVQWFEFDRIQSAGYVISQLATAVFGGRADSASQEEKLAALKQTLPKIRTIQVWDNFESVSGVSGSEEATGLLPAEDRQILSELLASMRGGHSRVLITSRSEELWLPVTSVQRLVLGGLSGEDRWLYCDAIVRDIGIKPNRQDPQWRALMNELHGHPVATRIVLLQLQSHSAEQLLGDLHAALQRNGDNDEDTKRLYAALSLLDALDRPEYDQPLQLIGLHRHYVDSDYLGEMLKEQTGTRDIEGCMEMLQQAGLVRGLGNNIWQMHASLPGWLMTNRPADEVLQRRFVGLMGSYAHNYHDVEINRQQYAMQVHGASMQSALTLSDELGMDDDFVSITFFYGDAAYKQRRLEEAAWHFSRLQSWSEKKGRDEEAAAACHHLGLSAHEQRDMQSAEKWYKKSVAISEKQGFERGAASSYHQLGRIALEQSCYGIAKNWYEKSLEIKERQGNEAGKASCYYQLGMVAQEQCDYGSAEEWYLKSLKIAESMGDERGAAYSYHQLGMIAQRQRKYESAQNWYKKALVIRKRQGDEQGAVGSYHQLGTLAQEHGDYESAEEWCKKSLAICEKVGDENGAAKSYHQSGIIAQLNGDFGTAETWYKRSMGLFEKQGDERGVASTYHQLGMIAEECGDYVNAETWYKRSLAKKEVQGDVHGAAITYAQLGIMSIELEKWVESGEYLLKALDLLLNAGDDYLAQYARRNYANLCNAAGADNHGLLRALWEKHVVTGEISFDELV